MVSLFSFKNKYFPRYFPFYFNQNSNKLNQFSNKQSKYLNIQELSQESRVTKTELKKRTKNPS